MQRKVAMIILFVFRGVWMHAVHQQTEGPPGLVKSKILLRRDCLFPNKIFDFISPEGKVACFIPNPVLHPLTHKPFGLWVREWRVQVPAARLHPLTHKPKGLWVRSGGVYG
jgi:hypothetical protein